MEVDSRGAPGMYFLPLCTYEWTDSIVVMVMAKKIPIQVTPFLCVRGQNVSVYSAACPRTSTFGGMNTIRACGLVAVLVLTTIEDTHRLRSPPHRTLVDAQDRQSKIISIVSKEASSHNQRA